MDAVSSTGAGEQGSAANATPASRTPPWLPPRGGFQDRRLSRGEEVLIGPAGTFMVVHQHFGLGLFEVCQRTQRKVHDHTRAIKNLPELARGLLTLSGLEVGEPSQVDGVHGS